jgi:hypothetical protein
MVEGFGLTVGRAFTTEVEPEAPLRPLTILPDDDRFRVLLEYLLPVRIGIGKKDGEKRTKERIVLYTSKT